MAKVVAAAEQVTQRRPIGFRGEDAHQRHAGRLGQRREEERFAAQTAPHPKCIDNNRLQYTGGHVHTDLEEEEGLPVEGRRRMDMGWCCWPALLLGTGIDGTGGWRCDCGHIYIRISGWLSSP